MRLSARITILLVAASLSYTGAFAQPAAPPTPAIVALRVLDGRVATLGYRLATAGGPLCAEIQWQSGFAVHDLSQYSARGRAEASATFGLAEGPAVLALANGGPAAAAGLHLDDVLLAADGAPLPHAPAEAHDTFAPTERIIAALETALDDGVVALDIRRAGAPLRVVVHAEQGCASRFQLIPSSELNSRADGRYVQITSAMAEFAQDDAGLAAVIAHELSHNILHHRARLNTAGVDRGLLANFGRSARLFRQTESEADRYSIYLLDRAGFDIQAAMRFWDRLARRTGGLFAGTTHPNWSARLASMRSEVAAIAAARRRGAEIRPPQFDLPLGSRRRPAGIA